MDQAEAYKYCLVCGNKVEVAISLMECNACGYKYYINPAPCVAVLITNPLDEVLLGKRKKDPFKDTWDLPGGFVELQEDFEEATVREIKEELSINIAKEKLQHIGTYYDRYLFSGVNEHTVSVVFQLQLTQEEIKKVQADDDLSEFQFFSKTSVPFAQIMFPSVRKILENFSYK